MKKSIWSLTVINNVSGGRLPHMLLIWRHKLHLINKNTRDAQTVSSCSTAAWFNRSQHRLRRLSKSKRRTFNVVIKKNSRFAVFSFLWSHVCSVGITAICTFTLLLYWSTNSKYFTYVYPFKLHYIWEGFYIMYSTAFLFRYDVTMNLHIKYMIIL